MTTPAVFRDRLPEFLAELRELVTIETPTRHVAGVERTADWLEHRLAGFSAVERTDLGGFGPMLRASLPGTGSRVLLLAHSDTVWPLGEWPQLWREADGCVYGPGVYDMKGGLLFALWALEALAGSRTARPEIELLITPDEEVGSLGSRTVIESAARNADFVLVLEPTIPGGPLKVARKGSGEYVVRITGRAAHQGVEPEQGRNAIVEAAHQVLALRALEDLAAGTTIGPNVIHGGSVSNVVAEHAELRVDVRVWHRAELDRIAAAMRSLRPVTQGTTVTVGGGWNRPPMEATALSMALFERARGIGAELGLTIGPVAWGGSSDANLTAQVGAPTIDGFGPVGGGAHQRSEHVVVAAIPDRLALLTHLLGSLAVLPESWLDTAARSVHRARRRQVVEIGEGMAVGS